jgi:hypothetical protein
LYSKLFEDFQNKGSDQTCLTIASTSVQGHLQRGDALSFNYDREFPFRPKVIVSLTGFQVTPKEGATNNKVVVELKDVTEEAIFNDKFELTIITIPGKFTGLEEVSFCYYAYLNFDVLVKSMEIPGLV